MSLVRLNIKSRIELETRVLAAALKQSFDRGDTDGASLAHKQLFHLLKDAGKAEPGNVDSIRISDGVLPGVAEGESGALPSATQISTAAGQPQRGKTATVDAVSLEPPLRAEHELERQNEAARSASTSPNVASDNSLAAKLYSQPLFGQYTPTTDENGEGRSEPSESVSAFRQGFMRNSARLHSFPPAADKSPAPQAADAAREENASSQSPEGKRESGSHDQDSFFAKAAESEDNAAGAKVVQPTSSSGVQPEQTETSQHLDATPSSREQQEGRLPLEPEGLAQQQDTLPLESQPGPKQKEMMPLEAQGNSPLSPEAQPPGHDYDEVQMRQMEEAQARYAEYARSAETSYEAQLRPSESVEGQQQGLAKASSGDLARLPGERAGDDAVAASGSAAAQLGQQNGSPESSTEPEQFIQQAADVVAQHVTPEQIIQASQGIFAPNMVPANLAHQLTAEMPLRDLQLNPSQVPRPRPTEELPAPSLVLSHSSAPGTDGGSALDATASEDGPGLYGLLGVSQMCAFEDIHRNFLRKSTRILREIKANRAIRYDKLPELQKLWIAHDILTDPVTRTDYDFRELGVRGTAEPIAHPAEEHQPVRMGARTPLRIGELLQCAGLLEPAELEIACDMHKAMPELQFGTFLVKQGFIEEHHLEAVLVGQKLLRAGAISVAQFQDAMDVAQDQVTAIGEVLIDKGYITPVDLNLALNPPAPDEPPQLTVQIREIPVPPRTVEIKTKEMKPAMPAWKDQLDWGPPADDAVPAPPSVPGQASITHAQLPAMPAGGLPKQGLAGLLSGQQQGQISNKNAVPSWTDQLDWATPAESSSSSPSSSSIDNASKTGGSGVDGSNGSADASADDPDRSKPEENPPKFSVRNAVPTWKDQLDWGSPAEGEVIEPDQYESEPVVEPDKHESEPVVEPTIASSEGDEEEPPEPWLSPGFIENQQSGSEVGKAGTTEVHAERDAKAGLPHSGQAASSVSGEGPSSTRLVPDRSENFALSLDADSSSRMHAEMPTNELTPSPVPEPLASLEQSQQVFGHEGAPSTDQPEGVLNVSHESVAATASEVGGTELSAATIDGKTDQSKRSSEQIGAFDQSAQASEEVGAFGQSAQASEEVGAFGQSAQASEEVGASDLASSMSFVAPPEVGGFFAHLADKTDIFEGSIPDSHSFGSFNPTALPETSSLAPNAEYELSQAADDQVLSDDDSGSGDEFEAESKEQPQVDETAGEDGSAADDDSSDGDPDSSLLSRKDKRRRTKEKKKKRK